MAQKKSFTIAIVYGLLFLSAAASLTADIKKFPPISGEIYGQVVPGVKSIIVNGRPVPFDENQRFRAFINLKAGEKYLTLTLNYEGIRIIKKYLVLRREAVKKFKIYVPKEKVEKTVRAARPKKERILPRYPRKPKLVAKRPKPKPKATIVAKPKPEIKVCEYLYVWEFSEGKLLLAKETEGKYTAEIHIPVSKEWLDLRGISSKELKEIIGTPVKSPNK